MKRAIAAAALVAAALAAPALAAPPVPGTLNEPQDLAFAKKGETASFAYQLPAGDYAIGAVAADRDGDVVLTVRTPQGAPVVKLGSVSEVDAGREFRIEKAGTYTVTAKDVGELAFYPYPYRFIVGPDCATGAKTTCQLKPGKTQQRKLLSASDVDWFAVQLVKGRTYRLSYEEGAPDFVLAFRDAKGKALAEGERGPGDPLLFKPAKGGAYFASVTGTQDGGSTYKVMLEAR